MEGVVEAFRDRLAMLIKAAAAAGAFDAGPSLYGKAGMCSQIDTSLSACIRVC
jgi:hypothetical protein